MVLAKSRLDFRSFERMVFIFFLDTVFSEFSSENYPFGQTSPLELTLILKTCQMSRLFYL